ncbi:MAG: prepilin-type N-terminal cleavage/methylation domain-containing protein [Thermodesulfobacteriota bacterium]|nr:prepilin-type N-terminal cleavage/methylation domain-containing protein [Thermodesulfobacteriota bacterium]
MVVIRKQQQGFTLVELVVIIVLLGIMAAVAMPKFFSMSTYQVRAAYDEVAGAVRYAQKLAVASGCEVRVQIDTTEYEDRYVLEQRSITPADDIHDDCASGDFKLIDIGHPVKIITKDGLVFNGPEVNADKINIALTSTPDTFIFDAMGRVVSGNDIEVKVGSSPIEVIAETGYVYEVEP